jgi:hypothetical protein
VIDESVKGLVARLAWLKTQFGVDAFRVAVFKAAVAVARVVLAEAEERARRPRVRKSGVVVRFPNGGEEGREGDDPTR